MTIAQNFQSGRVSRPARSITVGGSKLDAEALSAITDMTVKSEMNGLDRFELKVRNVRDHKKKQYLYSDQNTYLPGNAITIEIGYLDAGPYAKVFQGTIASIDARFHHSQPSIMTVRGLCDSAKLAKSQISRIYLEKSDVDIIKEIANSLGISITVASGGQGDVIAPYRIQVANYDLTFLAEKISALGLDFHFTDGGTKLYVGKAGSYTGSSKTLTLGQTLISFTGTVDTATQVNEVQVMGWDMKAKQAVTAHASRSQISEGSAWARDVKAAFADRSEIIADFPVHDQQTADAVAKGTMQAIANRTVTGYGQATDAHDLSVGQTLTLEGLDRRFSGTYRVTMVEHQFNQSGLKTNFEARMEASS